MKYLLSTVMMPSGIPVATVAINGGANAALLAAQILAVEDAALADHLCKRLRTVRGKLKRSEGKESDDAARSEELSFTADEWIDLGIYYPAAAYSDEKITMYLAKGLHKGAQDLDEDEFLNVNFVPIEKLREQFH